MKKNIYKILLAIFSVSSLVSCGKLIEVPAPKDSLITTNVFKSDDVATSAVMGIYNRMINTSYASGNFQSITSICGLSSDELINQGVSLTEFYDNNIDEGSFYINVLWSDIYQNIYAANSIIEQLGRANGISENVKNQLMGEVYFIRAFCYFYLTNLFGGLPLHLSTDYRINERAVRFPTIKIYEQIVLDLKIAEALISDRYITVERVRPNLGTVQSLLARVYLYTKDWVNAEKYSSMVIERKDLYDLEPINSVFLKNSKEAIWQLMPNTNTYTNEALLFILVNTPSHGTLRPHFALHGFEDLDFRKTSWIRSFTNATGTYYYPYKYKVRVTGPLTEYSMVFRLAEQFLIRAEARAEKNDIVKAIEDIDLIRKRAGILTIKESKPNISKTELLAAIDNERFTELFSEWGHRWFDLKRRTYAGEVLSKLKPDWQTTDELYPLPVTETSRNRNILQNEGY